MKITFWSDYACPFCWIGEVRLLKAIKELGLANQVTLLPRAFELNPEAPEQTEINGLTTIARRYNISLAQARAEFDKIAEMGQADGLELNQTETHHTNTFNAHRLMKLGLATADKSLAEKLNELLFAAFFVDNLNLADQQVLLQIGAKAGLEAPEIRTMLDSNRYAGEVRADEREAAKLGIHGVPYFIFENGATASGALSVGEFKNILKNASMDAKNTAGGQCGPEGCAIS